jgi:hypothetical protein
MDSIGSLPEQVRMGAGRGQKKIVAVDLAAKTPLQIHHAYQHGAAWVEGQVLKPPARVEAAHTVIERMRDDAHAANDLGGAERRLEREQEEGHGMSLSLIVLLHRDCI